MDPCLNSQDFSSWLEISAYFNISQPSNLRSWNISRSRGLPDPPWAEEWSIRPCTSHGHLVPQCSRWDFPAAARLVTGGYTAFCQWLVHQTSSVEKPWTSWTFLMNLNEPLRTEFMMAQLSPLGIASPRGRELYRLLCLPNALCRASRVAKDHRWRRVAFAERVRQKASELAWSWDELSRIFRGVSPRSSPVHHLKYQVLPSIYQLKLSSFLVCPIFFRTHRAIVFGGSGLWHVPRVVI